MAASAPISPRRLRLTVLAALIANVGIVLTGGIVRLTGSGLGCPDWPSCDAGRVVPSAGADAGWHQAIEFGNRLLTFVVLATAILVVLAVRRGMANRPRRAVRLAWLLLAGVLTQGLLGGITVLTGLHPLVVAAHFLTSMALIAIAVVLYDIVRDTLPSEPLAPLRWLTGLLVAVAAVVIVLGTLVTAAGPHAGDPGTQRLALDIRTVALAHADAVWLLLGVSVALLLAARSLEARRVARAAAIVLLVVLAQGTLGYVQYALDVPAQLVAGHLLGACLLWIAVVQARLASTPRPSAVMPDAPVARADGGAVASGRTR